MKLEILYKRSKTGKIVYQKIYATDSEHPTVTKESGQLATKSPLKHYETFTVGKNIGRSNETTPKEQAHLEMQSWHNKKKDEGYKSLEDLNVSII